MNKQNFTRQITRQHMQEELIQRVKKRVEKASDNKDKTVQPNDLSVSSRATAIQASLSFAESNPLPYTPPEKHDHLSQSNRFHQNMNDWLNSNNGDPALKKYDGNKHEYTDGERQALILVNNRIYQYKAVCINYTTYNLRRT
ncbi:hypothetical protein PHLCEN_2v4719 [Hermanssonia centrifuga]|uniref:Uncharacterized protein n=1 Tax=Hermanssonia centrifuga TaxID=98765 RepID=A0A2R6PK37_9APHY|nr:hypothetical protein PHLCEN_2v4719 [Hermanssonia centrifuga]